MRGKTNDCFLSSVVEATLLNKRRKMPQCCFQNLWFPKSCDSRTVSLDAYGVFGCEHKQCGG